MHIAASEGHLEVIKIMVEYFNAKINITNDASTTPLFQAVSSSHYSVAQYLLQKGCYSYISIYFIHFIFRSKSQPGKWVGPNTCCCI